MKEKKNGRRLMAGALALALSIGAVAPSIGGALNLEQNSVAYASELPAAPDLVENTDTDIVLHKLKFTGDKSAKIDNPSGKELESLPAGVEKYDKSLYGDVTFTLFKLTDANGKDVMISDFTGAVVASDNSKVTIGGKDFKLVKVEDQNVDAEGKATFSKKPKGTYAVIETASNPNLVNEREQPQLFTLPRANDNGIGFRPDVHLYPKNDVKDHTFEFTKYLDKIGDDSKLGGIEFTLYQGEKGQGTIFQVDGQPAVYTTDKDGKIPFKNLPVGKYYLVETKSKDGTTAYYAQNDKNNILTFEIGNLKDDEYSAQFINFTEPESDKKVADGKHDETKEGKPHAHVNTDTHNSYSVGELVPFEINLDIKDNILGGGEVKVAGKTTKAKPYSKFQVTDKPVDGALKIQDGTGTLSKRLNLNVTIGNVTLVEGTDYKISPDASGTGFLIDFIMRNNYAWTNLEGGSENVAAVSETVGKHIGERVTIKYDYELTNEAQPDKYIENEMTFKYNNHPDADENFDKEQKDKDNVVTYGKKFRKVTRTQFGLDIDESLNIPGAKFYLYRLKEDGSRSYLTEANGKRAFVDVAKGADGKFTAPADAYVLTSDKQGNFNITGLAEGEYYISEFEAPSGYKQNTTDAKFKAEKGSYEGEGAEVLKFENLKDGRVPITGSMVLIGKVLGSLGLIGSGSFAAGKFLLGKKRKEDEEE